VGCLAEGALARKRREERRRALLPAAARLLASGSLRAPAALRSRWAGARATAAPGGGGGCNAPAAPAAAPLPRVLQNAKTISLDKLCRRVLCAGMLTMTSPGVPRLCLLCLGEAWLGASRGGAAGLHWAFCLLLTFWLLSQASACWLHSCSCAISHVGRNLKDTGRRKEEEATLISCLLCLKA